MFIYNQVLPHMIKRNKGHLVVTSSIAGKIGLYPCYKVCFAVILSAIYSQFMVSSL